MLTDDQKAKFILALHKHSLQAYDNGGVVSNPQGLLPTTGGTGGVNASGNTSSGGVGGFISGLLGGQSGFQAGSANLTPGTNTTQLNNGLQSANQGLYGQQNFNTQAAAQNGFGNQANVFNQQQALANQLQAQANGQGPNPAQAALNQNTAANIANQGALMASQRGASANPALFARQIALQGANTQQQAVGQEATLGAQQQLAAQAALQNQQAQLQNVAGNQIAAQGQGLNAYSNAAQNEQGILQNANTAYNNALASMQGNINQANASTAAANAQAAGQAGGGLLGGISSAIGGLFAQGGEVKKYASGGVVAPSLSSPSNSPQSFVGQWLATQGASNNMGPQVQSGSFTPSSSNSGQGSALTSLGGSAGKALQGNGSTPYTDTMFTQPEFGGSAASTPSLGLGMPTSFGTSSAAELGASPATEALMLGAAKGGKVKAKTPAQKAVKEGNSLENDKVPALLSEGEFVLPRSVMEHPNAPAMAARFVAQHLAKKRASKI